MNFINRIIVILVALAGGLLSSCSPLHEAEVMTDVTFVLTSPIEQPTIKEIYQIKYLDYNTRIETTRGSVSTRNYTDHLQRGLYTIFVEGTIQLEDGTTLWVRGSKPDQLFMDSKEECRIELEIMP